MGVGPETRYARSGSLVIAYQDGGAGGVPVIWVPGFVSHVELQRELPAFGGFIERMERFARFITFDKRGTGLSDRSLGVGTLEDRMDDIRAVYDACGLERASVVAASEGGPLAIFFAATYPERVDRLVVYSSYTHETAPVDDVAAFRARILAGWGSGILDGLIVQHGDDAARAALARFERYACTPSMVAEKYDSDSALDVRATLGAVSAPTLVLHNQGDPLIAIDDSRAIAEGISGARFVELSGDFHTSWRPEDYDEMVEHIEEFLTGTHAIEQHLCNRVLTTVLFTDIVDSTARAGELGDRRWGQLLDDHDHAVRAELLRYTGREINTTGDGFRASFDAPARAVRCGQAITQAAKAMGVPVRVGIHTGECEVRGDDLAGIAVHIGARVAGLAAADEILVTSIVRDLVAGSGLQFDERGAHELKGVAGTWNILAHHANDG